MSRSYVVLIRAEMNAMIEVVDDLTLHLGWLVAAITPEAAG
jgi:hypothetical protein